VAPSEVGEGPPVLTDAAVKAGSIIQGLLQRAHQYDRPPPALAVTLKC
jgi:hypothetical protein